MATKLDARAQTTQLRRARRRLLLRRSCTRPLMVGLLTLLGLTILFSASAAARVAAPSSGAGSSGIKQAKEVPACEVFANPGNTIDVGEFKHASSIATIIEVECNPVYAEQTVTIAANELWSKCDRELKWIVASPTLHEPEAGENGGKEFQAELDDDGNATVAIIGGPSCAAGGGALVAVDLDAGTHPTTVTEVTIEPPHVTPEGVFLFPNFGGKIGSGAIESSTNSSLLGLAFIEFPPELAEDKISINDRQLFAKCSVGSKIRWFNEGAEKVAEGPEAIAQLDDDGNAFVVFEAGESCQAGDTLFEVSLVEAPYTTLTEEFNVLPPQPTFETEPKEEEKTKEKEKGPPKEEEKLEVIKEQRFKGQPEYSKEPKVGKLGEVVEYRITVKNTGTSTIELKNIKDPHCEDIVGPSQKMLMPGESAFYTCQHTLSETGKYLNVAVIETPHKEKESNEVEVEVPVSLEFTIEKEQRIQGQTNYTKSELTAKVGQWAEYRLIVTNTGNVTLKFSPLQDTKCEDISPSGAEVLKPKESVTYTCKVHLTHAGEYVNFGEITGTDEEGASKTKKSNEVLIDPPECALAGAATIRRQASGVKQNPFTVTVGARGIAKIAFYIDGRLARTMNASQARGGKFKFRVDVSALSFGAHRLTVKTNLRSPLCGKFPHTPVSVVFMRSSPGGQAAPSG